MNYQMQIVKVMAVLGPLERHRMQLEFNISCN